MGTLYYGDNLTILREHIADESVAPIPKLGTDQIISETKIQADPTAGSSPRPDCRIIALSVPGLLSSLML
jgi:hypothetical protein